LIINMLGFFIIAICTIIVRSDVKSLKNQPQTLICFPHTLKTNRFSLWCCTAEMGI